MLRKLFDWLTKEEMPKGANSLKSLSSGHGKRKVYSVRVTLREERILRLTVMALRDKERFDIDLFERELEKKFGSGRT